MDPPEGGPTPSHANLSPDNVFLPILNQGSVRELYQDHRTKRNATQRALLLDPTVDLVIDTELTTLLNADPPDLALDERHNMSIWTRPSAEVAALVQRVQERLRSRVGEDQGEPHSLHHGPAVASRPRRGLRRRGGAV